MILNKKNRKAERIDLSNKNSYLFKSWNHENSPMLPMIQIEHGKDKIQNLDTYK